MNFHFQQEFNRKCTHQLRLSFDISNKDNLPINIKERSTNALFLCSTIWKHFKGCHFVAVKSMWNGYLLGLNKDVLLQTPTLFLGF